MSEGFLNNIHVFPYNGEWLAVDAATLSIFEVDKRTADYLNNADLPDEVKAKIQSELKKYTEKGYFLDIAVPKSMEPYMSNYNISIQNTLDCPLNCKYCFSKKIDTKPRNMALETADKTIRFLFDRFQEQADAFEIYFTSGGEPLNNFPVIQRIYEEGRRLGEEYGKGFKVGFTTNTVLLDEDKLNYLKNAEIGMMISIDGTEEEHNSNRITYNGKGTFQYVAGAIEKLMKSSNGYINRPQALAVLTGQRDDYVKTYKYLVDMGFYKVNMKLARNLGKENQTVTTNDLPNIKKNYSALVSYITDKILENQWKYVIPILDHNNMLGQTIINMALRKKVLYRCDAGKSKFSILPNGDIYPCDFLSTIPETKMGSIFEGIDNGKKDKWFSMTCLNLDECKTCWARYVCAGTCYYGRHLNNGKPDEIECEISRFLIEEVAGMLYKVNKHNKTLFKHLKNLARNIKEITRNV